MRIYGVAVREPASLIRKVSAGAGSAGMAKKCPFKSRWRKNSIQAMKARGRPRTSWISKIETRRVLITLLP